MLFQRLLEQKLLIRLGSNYENLEMRREFCWDNNNFWKIPEPTIIKTSLPVVWTPSRNKQTRHTPQQRSTATQAGGKISTKSDASGGQS